MSKITPYLDIRDQLITGTLVNCEHKDLFWRLIGHTAVLYKDVLTGQLHVFESTTLNKFTGKSGVQMIPFGVWIAHYPGKVFVRIPEFDDISTGGQCAREARAMDFIKEHLGTSYPNLKTLSGRLKLYLSALDFKLFGVDLLTYKGDDEGIFCTMLIAMFLQELGYLHDAYAAREYEPDDTRGNASKFEKYLINVRYGKEIQLK